MIPNAPNFRVQSARPAVVEKSKVADFINPSTKKWNVQDLKRCVSDQDVKAIVSIPISKIDLSDKLIWHYSKKRYLLGQVRLSNSPKRCI